MKRSLLGALALGALLLSACNADPKPATASTTSGAPAAAPTPSKAAISGEWSGKVTRGYDIKFTVSPDGKQVAKVTANVLEYCGGSTTSSTTTVLLEGPFAVATNGAVTAEGKDQTDKSEYKFTASITGNDASGTILRKGVTVGTVCTTYELKWTAQKN